MPLLLASTITLILFGLLPPGTAAEPVSPRDLAAEVVAKVGTEEMMDAYLETLRNQQLARVEGLEETTREERLRIRPHVERVEELLQAGFGYASLRDELAAIYAETFTEEELRGISAFLSSAAGKVYIAESATIQEEINRLLRARMQRIFPEINLALVRIQAELQQDP